MKITILVIALALQLSGAAFAINADSLGGNPWTAYLKSNTADTANGPLWLNDVRLISSYTPAGGGYAQVWNNYGNQSVLACNYNPIGQ
ncbi:MAG: hypothetical protein Q8O74_04220, partial [bacterium]|nr:hypothetical protein [bacterium]